MTIESKSLSGPDLFGYVATPKAGARAGVLLLPTIFGVNEFVRSYAESWRMPASPPRCGTSIPACR